jgi:hypothetical protein
MSDEIYAKAYRELSGLLENNYPNKLNNCDKIHNITGLTRITDINTLLLDTSKNVWFELDTNTYHRGKLVTEGEKTWVNGTITLNDKTLYDIKIGNNEFVLDPHRMETILNEIETYIAPANPKNPVVINGGKYATRRGKKASQRTHRKKHTLRKQRKQRKQRK